MAKKRQRPSAEFKFRVALEALKERITAALRAQGYQVNGKRVRWLMRKRLAG